MKKSLYALVPALAAPMTLFADAAPVAAGNNMMRTVTLLGTVLVFFYLILWRPEQKRRKKMNDLRSSLKKGDTVTAMGIVGKIDKIKENTVVISMVEGAKLEMVKAAISEIQAPQVVAASEAPAEEVSAT